MRRRALAGSLVLITLTAWHATASAIGLTNGLGGPAGYGEGVLPANDDGSTAAIDLTAVFGAQGLNFFGANKTTVFVNNNGNITFNGATSQYTPTGITAASNPIIAAFFADVDTRGAGSGLVYYDLDTANHRLTATWDNVGYFNSHADKRNAFQIALIGVPPPLGAPGDFDIQIRYAALQWTTGDASGGSNGFGGTPARAGYSAGNGMNFYEFPESGDQGQMLALTGRSNVGTAGLFVFQVRGGGITPPPTYTVTATPTPTAPPSASPTRTPASNCCSPHDTAGCDDNACAACVCGEDPSCCAVNAGEWSATCVARTTDPDHCGLLCQCAGLTCSISPPAATNLEGTEHHMVVDLRQSGKPVRGGAMHVEVVGGPNAGTAGDFITDNSGQIAPFYVGHSGAGVDTITASGMINQLPFACSATKTWVLPECSIDPPSASNALSTRHDFTVHATGAGAPLAGATLTVSVDSGPNQGKSGQFVTDASGAITASYVGDRGAGTDVIHVSGVSAQNVPFSCMAQKYWDPTLPGCRIDPPFATNPLTEPHQFTVTVMRNDQLIINQPVTVRVTSGPNAGGSTSANTNGAGQVVVTLTSTGIAGLDVFEAFGVFDGKAFSCSGSKLWLAPTATPTRTLTPTRTQTATPTRTRTHTASPTTTATRTYSPSPTLTPTRTFTPTQTSTRTLTATRTSTVSPTHRASPSETPTRSATPSPSPTLTATATASRTAVRKPTFTPTQSPTATGTPTPSLTPAATASSTSAPTLMPTASHSPTASFAPTATRTETPAPTNSATRTPTVTPRPTFSLTGATQTPTLTPPMEASPTTTATGSETPSVTPTAKDTPTATPTEPATATLSPTSGGSGSPTPTVAPVFCPGDCNGDGAVTVDELILLVNIPIGLRNLDECPVGDIDGNREITIDEIIAAVNAALNGCVLPTPTEPTAASLSGYPTA